MMTKKNLKIPKFRNENEERKFWNKLDLSEYFEASDFEKVSFPNLKPTSRPISIRIPEYLLNRVKEKANEINVPYQSLIKEYIKKGALMSWLLNEELARKEKQREEIEETLQLVQSRTFQVFQKTKQQEASNIFAVWISTSFEPITC